MEFGNLGRMMRNCCFNTCGKRRECDSRGRRHWIRNVYYAVFEGSEKSPGF
jgi:hypothetical protein